MSAHSGHTGNEEGGLRIRPGMDVYSAYQDQFIGTVIRVWRERKAPAPAEERKATPHQTGSSTTETNPELAYPEPVYQGEPDVLPATRVGHRELGEAMGPFPTGTAGNTGPVNQSAVHEYATGGEAGDVVRFAVRPGRLNLGPLTRPLYIPTSAVRSISMERVVLAVQKDEMPGEWKGRSAPGR